MQCTRCRLVQPIELHGRTVRGRQAWCRPCFRAHAKSRGAAHGEQVRRSTVRRREVARVWVLSYLASHPCSDCGEADVVVLDFDHVGTKTADVSTLVANGRSLARVIAEVEQCEVVCANCHRARTARRGDWARASPDWRSRIASRSAPRARNQRVVLEHLEKTGCVDCGQRDMAALDFDHRPGTAKRGDVTRLAAHGCSLAIVTEEIAKCDVRCANCHRRRTAERARSFRTRVAEIDVGAVDLAARAPRARALRAEGWSLDEIAHAVGAARDTVGHWVRDVTLTNEQRASIHDRRRAARIAVEAAESDEPPRPCRTCGEEQPAAAFSRNGSLRRKQCKACDAARGRARTDEQRAEAAAKQRERRRRSRNADRTSVRDPGDPAA
ncbi:hypothetical protein GKE82_13195 [Conexibacter sp. W3-3-2]|uniref:hypothetical protein n=1 Tax=Conexibacter sp. W3-3-2 TaxID=2675227 RepID=UPI0012B88B17|nr:hypothetical protein [Conexibacter sp. W3-3-2]MTD45220.1 hypothetical protein [Conexibacter sp. W3-3-2]